MRPSIKLHADDKLVRRYRRLLSEDWRSDSVGEALEILHRCQQNHANGTGKTPSNIDDDRMTAILELVERVNLGRMPPVPQGLTAQKLKERKPAPKERKLVEQAFDAASQLTVQGRFTLQDDDGFFRDVQSVLFHCVIHFLLPSLDVKNLQDVRDLLVNALWYHSIAVWSDNASHQQYLQAALFGYLGQADMQEEALIRAFQLTRPDAQEDLLTKGQAVWMAMLDHGKQRQARDFMLEWYRSAPRECLPEIAELLEETMAPAGSK